MSGVTVLDPPAAAPPADAVRPVPRVLRVARQVARFVHDLLTEIP